MPRLQEWGWRSRAGLLCCPHPITCRSHGAQRAPHPCRRSPALRAGDVPWASQGAQSGALPLALSPRLAEAKAARGRAETRLGEREEQLAAMREELGRLHEASGASPDREALYKVRQHVRGGASIPCLAAEPTGTPPCPRSCWRPARSWRRR